MPYFQRKKRKTAMESEDEASSSSASTSSASDEYGDNADVLPDEEAIPDDELYAVSHIGRRRMNSVTGAIEYLTFWSGYVEPTWEPAENLSAAVEPLLIEADFKLLEQQRATEPYILPLDQTNVRRLVAMRRTMAASSLVVKREDDDKKNVDDFFEDPSVKLTPSNIMFDLVESMYASALRNRSLSEIAGTAPSATHSAVMETVRDAVLRVPDPAILASDGATKLVLLAPHKVGTQVNRKSWSKNARISTKKLQRVSSVMVAHAPCRLRLRPNMSEQQQRDDAVEILGLRRIRVDGSQHSKRHRAEHPAEKEEEAESSEDDECDRGAQYSFNVDFTLRDDEDDEQEGGGGDGRVELTLPLEQFRYQYPTELIHFLLSHAALYPLPPHFFWAA